MKKLILTGMAVAMLAIPAVASADSTHDDQPEQPCRRRTLPPAARSSREASWASTTRVSPATGRTSARQAHDLGGRGAAVQDTLDH